MKKINGFDKFVWAGGIINLLVIGGLIYFWVIN